jgi:hypothetical protein
MTRRPLALLSALMLSPACNPVTEEPPAAAPEPVAAAEQRFACTGRSRAPIPGQGEHRFRSKVSTHSGDAERAFRAR